MYLNINCTLLTRTRENNVNSPTIEKPIIEDFLYLELSIKDLDSEKFNDQKRKVCLKVNVYAFYLAAPKSKKKNT